MILRSLNKTATTYYTDVIWASCASNHWQFDSLWKSVQANIKEKKTALWRLALCKGNPPVTGGFPSQRASYFESVSIILTSSWLGRCIADPCNFTDQSIMFQVSAWVTQAVKQFRCRKWRQSWHHVDYNHLCTPCTHLECQQFPADRCGRHRLLQAVLLIGIQVAQLGVILHVPHDVTFPALRQVRAWRLLPPIETSETFINNYFYFYR